MKTTGIKYADLLRLADTCRTSPGSEWIDAAALAAALGDHSNTTTIKAAAPDNLAAAIAQAKQFLQNDPKKKRVCGKKEVANILGITCKTLRNWEARYKLVLRLTYGKTYLGFWDKSYDMEDFIRQLEALTENSD